MVAMLTDVGNFRTNNEDCIGYFEDQIKRIYVIADGMGGHNAGEVASKIAIDTVINYIKEIQNFEDPIKILKSAVELGNMEVYNKSQESPKFNGMGTTLTACLCLYDTIYVANVGDSSCFIIKNDEIEKVTKDHSLVQQLIDNGSLTEEEGENYPNKNIITRALGTNENVQVDIFIIPSQGVKKGILCTDGLTNVIKRDEILEIASNSDNISACNKLIETSKLNGSKDNISVIVFEGECN